MQYIQHVSFPRSGHHLLARSLRKLFPEAIHYCEFYGHCRRTPCTDPKTNYQKNHDLHLNLARSQAYLYLVQYRNPIEAIVSWYGVHQTRAHPLKRMFLPDTEAYWRRFFRAKLTFWKRYVEKWVVDARDENVCHVSYHRLLDQPTEELLRVAQIVFADRVVDRARVQTIVDQEQIAPKHTITEFRYYQPEFFAEMEQSVADYLDGLDIPRVTNP